MYASIAEIPVPSCIAGIPSNSYFNSLQNIPVITLETPAPVKGNIPRSRAFLRPASLEGLVITMGEVGKMS